MSRQPRKNELSRRARLLAMLDLLIVLLLLDPARHVTVLAVIGAVLFGLIGALYTLTAIAERRRGE